VTVRQGVSLVTLLLLGVQSPAAGATRVIVEPFPGKPGAAELRAELIRLLGRERGVIVVSDPSSAELDVSGDGETYVTGYVGANPRVRYLNSDARPVFRGFLSVELKNRAHDTIWSYLVTPRRLGPDDINRNLAGQIVRRLVEAVEKQQKAPAP
jgi:hypothetical protein